MVVQSIALHAESFEAPDRLIAHDYIMKKQNLMKKQNFLQDVEVLYLAPGDVLKGRVEPILWMRTCEWLSRFGYKTNLYSPYFYRKENIRRADVFSHFGVEELFGIKILPTLLSTRFSGLSWARLNLFSTYLAHLLPVFIRRRKRTIFYSKGQVCMQVVCVLERLFRIRVPKIFEIHSIGENPRLVKLLCRMDLVVTNSEIVTSNLVRKGIDRSKILIAYNAPFSPTGSVSQRSARQQLGLDQDDKIVAYAGKLYEKNVSFFLRLAENLGPHGIKVHIVGGNPRILGQADELTKTIGVDNVRFHGFVAPSEVPVFLASADALFCSYANDLPNIEQATPAKYFDYMQANKPLFCSRNTAIQELFTDGVNCVYFEPENPDDLARHLVSNMGAKNNLDCMVDNNKNLMRKLSWENRIRLIAGEMRDLPAQSSTVNCQ